MVYFRILGSMEAGTAAAVAALGPPKQRALLAILLIHLGEIIPIDRLIDLLWGDHPPRTAEHSVQIYISELRKALEPFGGDSLIVTRQPGYQLQAAPGSVDAHEFEQLVREGTARIAAGDRVAGVAALRSALGLWRGPALSDFAYEEFAQAYIRRLNDLHLDVIEDLAAAELDAGQTNDILPLLEAAIQEDPLRERSRELLMLALYRVGRHAEALRTFQRLRELLAEELGLDPSPPLQRLQERILLHDPTLVADGKPATDSQRRRNPYKGLRAFGEADAPDFFGRDALVDRLLVALREGTRLITLVGPSGSGKSSVVAAGLVPRLRSGAVDGSNRWLIATIVARANPYAELETVIAGASDASGDVPDGRRLLLIVDQFEELFSGADEGPRRQFLHALTEAVSARGGRVSALLTLRADFYDRPLLDAEFAAAFIPSVMNVVPMTAQELEAAVLKPAERAGVKAETVLLAELIAEMADRPGGLPMLQYALTELFDQQSDGTLTLSGYRRLGGLQGILSHRAEVVFSELGPEEQRAAMQVFLRLVRLGDGGAESRRRTQLSELTDLGLDSVVLSNVLESFGRHRFLLFDRDQATGRATVEVAHEALLREWDRLADWIDRHRTALRRHSTFQVSVDEWELSGRNPDYLLTGSRLAEFESWSNDGVLRLTGRERDYLEAGLRREEAVREEQAERRRLQRSLERRARRGLIALAGALAVLVIAVGLAFMGLQAAPADRVALLQRGPGEIDYLTKSGFDRAVEEFGWVGHDRLMSLSSDGVEELRSLSADGSQLILVFAMDLGLFHEVARAHPETHYMMLGEVGTEPNVTYLWFDDHEGAFLAGAAAALKTDTGTIGFVGGVDVPAVWQFQAGFGAGARAIDPEVEILSAYLTTPPDWTGFASPAAARQAAEAMYRKGADIVLHAAGSSGVGVFEAAADMSESTGRELWAIGADADQYETIGRLPGVVEAERWRRHILTSVVNRFDEAIYGALAEYARGSLQPGIRNLDLESGGIDISYSGGFIDDIRPRLEELKSQIIAGQIAVPCLPAGQDDEAADQGPGPSGAELSCRR